MTRRSGARPEQVCDGLFYGGDLAHAAQLVRDGDARKHDFTFFRGRIDWRPGELRGEVEAGDWVVASS